MEGLFNRGELAVVDQLFDTRHRGHVVADANLTPGALWAAQIVDLRQAFPDMCAYVRNQYWRTVLSAQRIAITGTHDGQSFRGPSASDGRDPGGHTLFQSVLRGLGTPHSAGC